MTLSELDERMSGYELGLRLAHDRLMREEEDLARMKAKHSPGR